MESMTKKELTDRLTELGITFDPKASKAALEKLLPAAPRRRRRVKSVGLGARLQG